MIQPFDDSGHARRRDLMVERDIAGRSVTDERVPAAMGSVPRERFLPPEMAEFAYEDSPLPIGSGQTISQPFIVALMAAAAEPGPLDRVLEIDPAAATVARNRYSCPEPGPLDPFLDRRPQLDGPARAIGPEPTRRREPGVALPDAMGYPFITK